MMLVKIVRKWGGQVWGRCVILNPAVAAVAVEDDILFVLIKRHADDWKRPIFIMTTIYFTYYSEYQNFVDKMFFFQLTWM